MPWFSSICLPFFPEVQKLQRKLLSVLSQFHAPSPRNRVRNSGLNHLGHSNYFIYDMWPILGQWDMKKDCGDLLRKKSFLNMLSCTNVRLRTVRAGPASIANSVSSQFVDAAHMLGHSREMETVAGLSQFYHLLYLCNSLYKFLHVLSQFAFSHQKHPKFGTLINAETTDFRFSG